MNKKLICVSMVLLSVFLSLTVLAVWDHYRFSFSSNGEDDGVLEYQGKEYVLITHFINLESTRSA